MCESMDTHSLMRCSSAATISSVLSQETLDRRSQYRSCLYRTESEFLENPTVDFPTASSNIISLLPTSTCRSSDASDDTDDLISCAEKSAPLVTKSRVVRESLQNAPGQNSGHFTADANAFELWLVKKLKLETAEKEKLNNLKKVELEKSSKKTARGHSAHKQWVQKKTKLQKEEKNREERETEEKEKEKREKEENQNRKNQKAEESYQLWLKSKEEEKQKEKEKKTHQKLKLKEEAEQKKRENELKFKEWLRKVNETNPKETSYINTKPWIPPIPRQIPTKKKSGSAPRPATSHGRPRTASSAPDIRRKPLLTVKNSACFVNWA